MSADLVVHPSFIASLPRGLDDCQQYWQLRGYDLTIIPGSRFLHVEAKPVLVRELFPGVRAALSKLTIRSST